MKRRLFLPENKIKRLYREGWTITALSEKFYCSYYAVWSRLNEAGLIREKKHVPVPYFEIKNYIEVQGLNLSQIAEQYGVTIRTISRKKKESWDPIERGGWRKTSKYMPLLVGYLRKEKGMKIREIAKKLSLSPTTVWKLNQRDTPELRDNLQDQGGHRK